MWIESTKTTILSTVVFWFTAKTLSLSLTDLLHQQDSVSLFKFGQLAFFFLFSAVIGQIPISPSFLSPLPLKGILHSGKICQCWRSHNVAMEHTDSPQYVMVRFKIFWLYDGAKYYTFSRHHISNLNLIFSRARDMQYKRLGRAGGRSSQSATRS